MWPVAAVIGENGGMCFQRDRDIGATGEAFAQSSIEAARIWLNWHNGRPVSAAQAVKLD